ncbi:putative o-succinylbenzoate synthase [Microcystis aeruginosa PCC 9809]|uniref:o-succinylbenzoate synthase n=1 Tax=Microcystis aeruginosa PCC 9809 TaxID=1160285 RepID=I4HNF5_MICAE|nr:o-succinylbenzoate synthase [Microcystis aeruginosa]CCI23579.1 putative o-succinylbenzoate synthase [Microcystis aeruginosa PCC 9809]
MYFWQFRVYQRPLLHPLQTHHGLWQIREGIIIRLEAEDGRIGWGEIAPLPEFGSETLSAAILFCQSLENPLSINSIFSIPEQFPACQFAFESALEDLSIENKSRELEPRNYSYLLPTGAAVFPCLDDILAANTTNTYKWKIAVNSLKQELNLFEKLIDRLPRGIKLRLDANGGLSIADSKIWLKIADESKIIEFIEQPLPPSQWLEMLQLSQDFTTGIALDESVANLRQIEGCYQRGWRGIFVIKPAITGSIHGLRHLWKKYPLDLVFSSVLETNIGRKSALRLAQEYPKKERALGFGVQQWFNNSDPDWLEKLWMTSANN